MKKLFAVLKTSLSLALFSICFSLHAQMPVIDSSFPKIAPSSPTVSGLMKFEEVPVNNYTGVPDISIPLFSVQTKSPDITLNLSLNYHPGSIAANEVASYVGLGWNLFAGGTISRTVRGFPDDINKLGSISEARRYGIHTTSNTYYDVIENKNTQGQVNHVNPTVMQYMWETVEKGWYDTEHDLYQYNFMGYTGRFYITGKNGIYEVVKLDNNNSIKITYNNTAKSFTLYDDKGYKYIFNITETTTCVTNSTSEYFVQSASPPQNNPTQYSYISAFHLAEIQDNNSSNVQLASFTYAAADTEKSTDITEVSNVINEDLFDLTARLHNLCVPNELAQFYNMEPKNTETMQSRSTATRKLASIQIPSKAKILFKLDTSSNARLDKKPSMTVGKVATSRLQEITITDWYDNNIKKYEFSHLYSEIIPNNKRMMLEKVVERGYKNNIVDTNTQSYELFYVENQAGEIEKIGKDHWGFFNYKPNSFIGNYSETSPKMCTVDVLQQMVLPTGGIINYTFESNEYSYDGAIRLEDFSENPDRFIETSNYINVNKVNTPIELFRIQDKQDVRFTGEKDPNPEFTDQWKIEIKGMGPSDPIYNAIVGPSCCNVVGPNCCIGQVKDLEPSIYYASLDSRDYAANFGPTKNSLQYGIAAYYKIRNPENYDRKYLVGGGVRIKAISYWGDINTLLKTKLYNYDFFDEYKRSSGSLAFPKPVLTYNRNVMHTISKKTGCYTWDPFFPKFFNYNTRTTFDNLKTFNTQGSFVGYKNVTVYETDNGKAQYTYTSPIDYPVNYDINYQSTPNPTYAVNYPFLSAINLDHRRGILKNEKYYDNNSTLLSETVYEHDIEESSSFSGVIFYSLDECPHARRFLTYAAYVSDLPNLTIDGFNPSNCGPANVYLNLQEVHELFGWVKLKSKKTKNYFYNKTNTQNSVEVKETFDYHSNNKKISEYTKETYNKANTTPDILKDEYVYLYNPNYNDISRIEKIRSYNNGDPIGRQTITYSNLTTLTGNNTTYLPQTIATAKGTSLNEDIKVRFIKYDIYGNVLEAKKENGIPVAYIYDFNHQGLIAMIENATYAQVIAALGAPIVSTGYTEADMVQLNNLRNSLLNVNVTTYTYLPLVGISTITDPRGQKTSYFYDSFGRLIQVKDHNNNILSENVYKYKNQN